MKRKTQHSIPDRVKCYDFRNTDVPVPVQHEVIRGNASVNLGFVISHPVARAASSATSYVAVHSSVSSSLLLRVPLSRWHAVVKKSWRRSKTRQTPQQHRRPRQMMTRRRPVASRMSLRAAVGRATQVYVNPKTWVSGCHPPSAYYGPRTPKNQ